ncbi:aldo/keto reductase [Streptomyces sp. N35]|uniref:aldo/keto reductase n=1 Tax=Streptomyces sp. N35 TaxID=2795730 RepID=UPI0018F6449C|nr:aldo/keto reductase [Streptomyces sp. N35]
MIATSRLASTDVTVSRLSFGAAPIAGLFEPVPDQQAYEAVTAAWDAGIRTFDTAPHYGLGVSERRLGEVLRDKPRPSYTLSTKVGRLLEPYDGGGDDLAAGGFAVPATHRRVWDFTADGVRRSIEGSLERLGLDQIDIVYLHDPDDHEEWAFREGYPALEQLRSEGVVGAIGAGMNQAEMLTRFITDTDTDVVLAAGRYTLLDQIALKALLPEAEARGRSVIAAAVYNSGILAEPRPGATYNYTTAPDDLLARARRIKELAEQHGTTLRAAALAFPLGHPAVAGVLVGMRSADQVRDTAQQFATPVPAGFWADLKSEGLLAEDVPVPGAAAAG